MVAWRGGRKIAAFRSGYATSRPTSTAPPQPRAYKPIAPSDRVARHLEEAAEPPKPKKLGLAQRLFSLRGAPEEPPPEKVPKDILRGWEASQRVVREGVLDARYKGAARKVTAAICAAPIAIYLTVELYQRRFQGKEQKNWEIPQPKESAT